jgi:hypothetical protein
MLIMGLVAIGALCGAFVLSICIAVPEIRKISTLLSV